MSIAADTLNLVKLFNRLVASGTWQQQTAVNMMMTNLIAVIDRYSVNSSAGEEILKDQTFETILTVAAKGSESQSVLAYQFLIKLAPAFTAEHIQLVTDLLDKQSEINQTARIREQVRTVLAIFS